MLGILLSRPLRGAGRNHPVCFLQGKSTKLIIPRNLIDGEGVKIIPLAEIAVNR